MPRRDGTGPMSMGPMTGKGFGICRNTMNYEPLNNWGSGCRNGFGRGFGRCFASYAYNSKTRKELLEEQKEFLKNQLDAINVELNNVMDKE